VQRPRVVHGREHAVDLQPGIEPVLDLLDRLDQEGHRAQGEELADERDDDAVRRGEGVDREEAEGGLAVDEDDVVVVRHLPQGTVEDLLAGHFVDELHLGGRQVDVGGQQVDVLDRGVLDGVLDGHLAVHQHVVDRHVELVRIGAQARGEGALRVEVHEQHPAARLGERGAEVDGRRRLADPALLVDHRDDPRRAVRFQDPRLRELRHRAAGGAESRVHCAGQSCGTLFTTHEFLHASIRFGAAGRESASERLFF
jgi:hypothetical protein